LLPVGSFTTIGGAQAATLRDVLKLDQL